MWTDRTVLLRSGGNTAVEGKRAVASCVEKCPMLTRTAQVQRLFGDADPPRRRGWPPIGVFEGDETWRTYMRIGVFGISAAYRALAIGVLCVLWPGVAIATYGETTPSTTARRCCSSPSAYLGVNLIPLASRSRRWSRPTGTAIRSSPPHGNGGDADPRLLGHRHRACTDLNAAGSPPRPSISSIRRRGLVDVMGLTCRRARCSRSSSAGSVSRRDSS